jgi:hypothetical protein
VPNFPVTILQNQQFFYCFEHGALAFQSKGI